MRGSRRGEGVTHAEVFRVFAGNLTRLRDLLMKVIENLPAERDCPCPHALDDLPLPITCPDAGGLAARGRAGASPSAARGPLATG